MTSAGIARVGLASARGIVPALPPPLILAQGSLITLTQERFTAANANHINGAARLATLLDSPKRRGPLR
ncbi:MAG: immunity 52 family protein [Ktedonobacterales bacterium]|nr:immunity 52 family protein [Ktedonobacterales bacterium]